MESVTSEFISKYQSLYEEDPQSRIFAPLAEAYRKSGHLQKALSICKKGCQQHPLFASGHVCLGRIYKDLKQYDKALIHLQRAIDLAPENIQAHQLMADIHIDAKNLKLALTSYKQVLLLNPRDIDTFNKVKRLESLSSDEFDSDTFQIGNLFEKESNSLTLAEKQKASERLGTLVDAFLVRNEFDKALNTLNEGIQKYGNQKELTSRLKLIEKQKNQFINADYEKDENIISPMSKKEKLFSANQIKKKYKKAITEHKIEILETLLNRLSDKKSSYFSYDPT